MSKLTGLCLSSRNLEQSLDAFLNGFRHYNHWRLHFEQASSRYIHWQATLLTPSYQMLLFEWGCCNLTQANFGSWTPYYSKHRCFSHIYNLRFKSQLYGKHAPYGCADTWWSYWFQYDSRLSPSKIPFTWKLWKFFIFHSLLVFLHPYNFFFK